MSKLLRLISFVLSFGIYCVLLTVCETTLKMDNSSSLIFKVSRCFTSSKQLKLIQVCNTCTRTNDPGPWVWTILKASANKIKILVFFIWNGPCICYLEWLFMVHLSRTTPEKKFGRESSSEVRKMLGCSNQNYENFDFICRRLTGTQYIVKLTETGSIPLRYCLADFQCKWYLAFCRTETSPLYNDQLI